MELSSFPYFRGWVQYLPKEHAVWWDGETFWRDEGWTIQRFFRGDFLPPEESFELSFLQPNVCPFCRKVPVLNEIVLNNTIHKDFMCLDHVTVVFKFQSTVWTSLDLNL